MLAVAMSPRLVVSSLSVVLALVPLACGGGGGAASTTTRGGQGTQQDSVQSDIYFGALDVVPAPGGKGVLVRGVEKDSPAYNAGLQHGDVITAMEGSQVA